jgi:hypothetical protein
MVGEFTVTGDDPGEDTTPPTVTAAVTGTQDGDGNYVGSASVALTATDESGGSGVDSVEYQLDGGAWETYAAPVEVSTVGDHTVAYRATDVAGNTSAEGSESFTVVEGSGEDTTPPTVSASVAGAQDPDGNYVGSATVTVTAADDGSGVASVEYQVNDQGWTAYTAPVEIDAIGSYHVLLRATDAAGNAGAGEVRFTVVEPAEDTTPPTVDAEVSGTQDDDGNYVDLATVTLSATDDGSGVATVEYKLDDGAWTAYTAAVAVNTPGMHMLSYRATDQAGNVSEEGSASFTVVSGGDDTVAPSVSAVVTGTQDAGWNYVDAANINLSALDVGSGVASVEYKLDDGAWTAYSAPVVVDTAGAHTFAYRATDNAGNVSAELTGAFTIVESGPGQGPDVCPSSDVRDTVIIGGIDSQVANVDTGNGCTVNDVIDENGQWRTHNQFVKHVKAVTKELVQRGVLTSALRDRIVTAAVNSDVGSPASRV